jgi:4-hydroxy-3-polyprenylbenzoate decarboxylase
MKQRLIIGISGATGFQYGVRALELLQHFPEVEAHLVMTKGAEQTRALETTYSRESVIALADKVYSINDIGAAVASGSFQTLGMLVAPCSIRSLSAIALGLSDNLLTRAADVVLKERRRLVLMVRETPFNLSHLDNMKRVAEMGGIIFPPVPAFYQQPKNLDEMVTHTVSRALDLFGLAVPNMPRWGE